MSQVDLLTHLRKVPNPSVPAILATGLTYMQQQLAVTHIVVYRVQAMGKAVWFEVVAGSEAQARSGALEPFGVDDPYQQAMITGEAQHLSEMQIIYPLPMYGAVSTVLVITHEAALSDAVLTQAGVLVPQLGFALEHAQLQGLLQQQHALTASLKEAETLEKMVSIIAAQLADEAFEVALLVHGAMPTLLPEPQNIANLAAFVGWCDNMLNYEIDILVPAVSAESRLTEEARAWLDAQGITSFYDVKLPDIENPLVSVLVYSQQADAPIMLNTQQRDFYRSVAAQAAALMEREKFSQETRRALEETRRLYDLTHELSRARDYPDMLGTFFTYVEDGVDRVSLARITYVSEDMIDEIILTHIMDQEGMKELNVRIDDAMDEAGRQSMVSYWNTIGDDLEVVEDINDVPDNLTMADYLRSSGMGSGIAIPILDGQQRIAQLSLLWSEPRQFSPSLINLLETAQSHIRLIVQNLHLLRDTRANAEQARRQAHILRELNQLVEMANKQVDEQTLLDEAARVLLDSTQCDHVGIGVVERSGTMIRIMSELPDKQGIGSEVRSDGDVATVLRETRQAMIVQSVANDERLAADLRELIVAMGIHSIIFLPMFDLDGRLLGTIGLDYYRPMDAFDTDMIEIAQTIVSELGLAIQKQRLLSDSQQQTERMQQITHFSQSVQAQLELPNIINIALSSYEEIIPHKYFSILLYDREENQLRLAGHRHLSKQQVSLPGRIVGLDENNFIYRVWRERDLIYVQDIQSEVGLHHPLSNEIYCFVGIPLVSGGIWMGVVEVGADEVAAYSQTDLAILRQMTDQLAVALSNAEAYSQSQRLARNKALSNDIISQLQQQTEIETILKITIKELGQALGARRARIRLGMDAPVINEEDAS